VVRAAPERFAVQPDLVSELQQLPGVIWACVTPPTPRHHRLRPHLPPRLPDLVAVVDRVESSRQSAELGYSHPANAAEPAEFENRVGLGANVVGLVLAGMGAVMRFTRLPAEVAGWWLVTAAEAQPRVRGTLEAVFGRVPTDVGMAVLNGVGPAAVEARCSGPQPRTIEALGRVDTLCFDEAGTLTEGRITLAGVAGRAGEFLCRRRVYWPLPPDPGHRAARPPPRPARRGTGAPDRPGRR
jgi:hypothetical protein